MTHRLILFDPGHFHAALLQKEMDPALLPRVAIYAPLGTDLLDYLARIAQFNSRPQNPTRWELDVHTSAAPLEAMLRDRTADVALFAGRNRPKIDAVLAALEAGLHVLCDKPWILSSADLPKLERALEIAGRRGLIAYDIMTERYEVTSQLQRALVSDEAIFGQPRRIHARSVHCIKKLVAGVPLRRPAWFFDIEDYGEGLSDVGTHVVDLVQWTAFAGRVIDYRRDIELLSARRWPLQLSAAQYEEITGQPRSGPLDYYCNNSVAYKLCGVPVELEITWDWQAPPGAGDVYEASFEGTHARIEIRQGAAERQVPELYVTPPSPALRQRVEALQDTWPGLALAEAKGEVRLVIPERYRVGHEAHFGQVARRFFEYLADPGSLPSWERPNMLAKYFVSTKGVELAQAS